MLGFVTGTFSSPLAGEVPKRSAGDGGKAAGTELMVCPPIPLALLGYFPRKGGRRVFAAPLFETSHICMNSRNGVAIRAPLRFTSLSVIVFFIASFFFSPSISAGEIARDVQKRLVLEISRSSEFSGYFGARGMDLIRHHAGRSFKLRQSVLRALDDKQLAEEGYTNTANYTYVWKGGECTISFPVRIEKDKVLKIGHGMSDGGCGE